METRDTVGKLSTLILDKEPNDHSAHEQMQEQLADYEKNFWETVDKGKRIYAGDFYINIITKKERIMQNVIRNYFFTTSSCPTPTYDQAVHKFNFKNESIDFLWVIPDKDTCKFMMDNFLNIHPEEWDLRDFVLSFENGKLLDMAKKFNGEMPDSPLLIGA